MEQSPPFQWLCMSHKNNRQCKKASNKTPVWCHRSSYTGGVAHLICRTCYKHYSAKKRNKCPVENCSECIRDDTVDYDNWLPNLLQYFDMSTYDVQGFYVVKNGEITLYNDEEEESSGSSDMSEDEANGKNGNDNNNDEINHGPPHFHGGVFGDASTSSCPESSRGKRTKRSHDKEDEFERTYDDDDDAPALSKHIQIETGKIVHSYLDIHLNRAKAHMSMEKARNDAELKKTAVLVHGIKKKGNSECMRMYANQKEHTSDADDIFLQNLLVEELGIKLNFDCD